VFARSGPIAILLALGLTNCACPMVPLSKMAQAPSTYDDASKIGRRVPQAPAYERSAIAPPRPEAVSGRTESTSSIAEANSADWKPIPRVGTPEWEQEKAEDERREKEIDRIIHNICRGC
jgi:hypothetical protein